MNLRGELFKLMGKYTTHNILEELANNHYDIADVIEDDVRRGMIGMTYSLANKHRKIAIKLVECGLKINDIMSKRER